MSDRDELTDKVREVILSLGEDFELDWQREPGWVTCSMNRANQVIALVRADERKRIQDALLSDEVVALAADRLELADTYSETMKAGSEWRADAISLLTDLAAAIGLTEEGAGHE